MKAKGVSVNGGTPDELLSRLMKIITGLSVSRLSESFTLELDNMENPYPYIGIARQVLAELHSFRRDWRIAQRVRELGETSEHLFFGTLLQSVPSAYSKVLSLLRAKLKGHEGTPFCISFPAADLGVGECGEQTARFFMLFIDAMKKSQSEVSPEVIFFDLCPNDRVEGEDSHRFLALLPPPGVKAMPLIIDVLFGLVASSLPELLCILQTMKEQMDWHEFTSINLGSYHFTAKQFLDYRAGECLESGQMELQKLPIINSRELALLQKIVDPIKGFLDQSDSGISKSRNHFFTLVSRSVSQGDFAKALRLACYCRGFLSAGRSEEKRTAEHTLLTVLAGQLMQLCTVGQLFEKNSQEQSAYDYASKNKYKAMVAMMTLRLRRLGVSLSEKFNGDRQVQATDPLHLVFPMLDLIVLGELLVDGAQSMQESSSPYGAFLGLAALIQQFTIEKNKPLSEEELTSTLRYVEKQRFAV